MATEDKRIRWCRTAPADAVRLAGSNEREGLSHKEAYRRLRANGTNRFMEPPKQARGILKGLLRDPILLLTLVCGILSVCFGEWLSGLPFLCLAVAWGIWFVGRLLRGIGRLQNKQAYFETPSVTVLREGEAFCIPSTRVVRGDILILHEGDIVPCDCRLLSGEDLTVRLTWREGEKPTPHLYRKSADRLYAYGDGTFPPNYENMVYGGSEIVGGSAVALAVELGETSFLGAMGARPNRLGKRTEGPISNGVLPYFRLFSFLSLFLLFLCGIVSLYAAPSSYTSLRVFLPVCVMTTSASVGVTELYVTALCFRNRRLSCAEKQGRERALIRTDAANETLPYVDDLFVVGTAAFADGKRHLCAVCNGGGVVSDGRELRTVAEAFVLLAKAREALPSAKCDRFTEPEDMTYLGELLRMAKPDLQALDIRLQSVRLIGAGEEDLVHVATNRETYRLHFSEGVGAIAACTAVSFGDGTVPMTPFLLETLLRFAADEERQCRVIRSVVRESHEGLALLGLLSLGEARLPNLQETLEDLRRLGVRVSIFPDAEEERAQRLAHSLFPAAEIGTSADLADESANGDLFVYTGVGHREIAACIRRRNRAGRVTALLCNRTSDRALLSAPALRLVADDCFARFGDGAFPEQIPFCDLQTTDCTTPLVRDGSDLILCRAGQEGGGIAALPQLLRRSRLMTHRLRALLWNLTLVKLSRMLLFTLCTLSGLGPPTAAETFFSCFGGDTVAMLAALRGGIRVPNAERVPFRANAETMVAFWKDRRLHLSILLPPLAIWLVTLFMRITGLLTSATAQSVPLIGLQILQTVLLIFAESDAVRARSPRDYAKVALVMLVPLLPSILLSCLVPSFGVVTGLGAWSLSSALMPIVCLLLSLGGTLSHARKDRK